MKNASSIIQNVFVAVLSTIVIFIILEFAARIYLERFASNERFFRYASLRQLEERLKSNNFPAHKKSFHRYLGSYLTPNYRKGKNRHNALGYRGDEITQPKPAGEFRIVCLGGSTTYTSGVEDYHKSYPELLEKELVDKGFQNVNVINAGTPGWSSWESLINFQLRILDLDPDMIIIYHAINDIHARLVWPPDAYQGDNSGRSAPNITNVFMPSIFEYSTLIRFFLVRAGLTRPHVDVSRTIDRRAETYYGSLFQSQKMRKIYPQDIFKEVSAVQMLATNKPVYFKRNIENIVNIANIRGIKTILATFAYSTLFENEPRASSEEYISAYHEAALVLKEIAGETGAYLFDFASIFPMDKKYFHDGRHVNEKGAKLKAKLFSQFIIDNRLLSNN